MAQLQWLGVLPREDAWSYLAEAIREGLGAYVGARERREQRKLERARIRPWERYLELEERKLTAEEKRIEQEYLAELRKVSQKELDDAIDGIERMLGLMNEQAATAFLSDPQVTALYKAANRPIPWGAYGRVPEEESIFAPLGRRLDAVIEALRGRRRPAPTPVPTPTPRPRPRPTPKYEVTPLP